jgi:F0F1-type ATP synthase assembly protein I
VVGGYLLDQRLNSSPWLVLTGLVVAILATCGILWRTVTVANRRVAAIQPKRGEK